MRWTDGWNAPCSAPLPDESRTKEAAIGTVRVVAGSARGRRLIVPGGAGVRPTMDRIREALFSILGEALPGRTVMDLFSGSGALGIEALSRGAAHAVFVDSNPLCIGCIRRNLARCGFSSVHPVLRCRLPEGLTTMSRSVGRKSDIVFMDPPYGWDGLAVLLGGLHRCSLLAERATIVLEHFHKDVFANLPAAFAVSEQRRYGDTVLTFFHHLGGDPAYGER